jgi:hypothetical protein
MKLTRSNVTIASRVMLPTYLVVAFWIGPVYVLDPGSRLQGSPAFPILPRPLWGAGFVLAAAVLLAAMLVHKRRLAALSLSPMCLWFGLWMLALGKAAIFDGSSYSAPALPFLAMMACWASMLSLLAGES